VIIGAARMGRFRLGIEQPRRTETCGSLSDNWLVGSRRRGQSEQPHNWADLRKAGVTVVYPVLFRIGNFEITSFGVLVAIAALVGIWLFGRELARRGLPREGVDGAIAGVFGGFLGAKLLWTVEFLGQQPVTDLLFGRGGFSWFGGLIGGVGVGLWMLRRRRVAMISALAAATPALAVGHAIGRVGCFMVGDDYGRPSNLPWAVAFPEGLPPTDVPVHPTQLYEAIALAALAWALIRWRRADVDDAVVLGRYLVLAGSTRFAIEFIRVNAQLFGPFTLAQSISFVLVTIGMVMILRQRMWFLSGWKKREAFHK
jgi:phosphatidylglycerol:prolipoprotein diacylglycerol transferase